VSEHTQVPWRLSPTGLTITDGKPDANRGFVNGRRIATMSGDFPLPERQANAALIVRTANAHDALVAACEAALRYDAGICGRAARGEVDLIESGGGVAAGDDLDALYLDWVTKARAALARAKQP
jgi:hypothetical protein